MSCQSLRWLFHGEAKFLQMNIALLEPPFKKDMQILLGEYKARGCYPESISLTLRIGTLS